MALSGDRNPSFETILKVISALGLQLSTSVKVGEIVEEVAEVEWIVIVQLRSAGVSCGKAALRTSPSSGQAAFTSQLRNLSSLPATQGRR
jgi:hypothetical protein